MTAIEQEKFIEGYVNGVCTDDRCDLYAAYGIEGKDDNMVIPLEAVSGTLVDNQITDLTNKINAMLEGEGLPYSAYISIDIVFTPEERSQECKK